MTRPNVLSTSFRSPLRDLQDVRVNDDDSPMTDMTVPAEYRPLDGEPREIRVTGEQLHAQACIVGTSCTGDELVDAGHVYTSKYGWAVVAHPKCLKDATMPQRTKA
jgi:hypothetical protein